MQSIRGCSVAKCDRGHYARDYCRLHYDRWRASGDPYRVQKVHGSLAERFARWTQKSGDCLLWTGRQSRDGYGQIVVSGSSKRAHRVAYEMANGPIPDGLMVRHRCDTPLCVNPEHLQLGTAKQNTEDAIRRGRFAVGERNGDARLTDDQAREIYRRVKAGDSRRELSAEFSVGTSTIGRIARGESWVSATGARP